MAPSRILTRTAIGLLTALVLVALGFILANLPTVWGFSPKAATTLVLFGPLTLLGGTLAAGMRLRGRKTLLGLHRATWLSPIPAFVLLFWVQEQHGFRFALPEPPLDGFLTLCLTAALVEGRIRREGRLLFRTRALTHLVFASVLALFIALNFVHGFAYVNSGGPDGCAAVPTYGFPKTGLGLWACPHLWHGLEPLVVNLASVLIMLAATGYVLEGLLPRTEVPRQRMADSLPLLAYAALCVILMVPMLNHPGQIRNLSLGLRVHEDSMGVRMVLQTGLWTILFTIGAAGLIRALVAERRPLLRLLKAAVTPLPPLPVASPSGKAQP